MQCVRLRTLGELELRGLTHAHVRMCEQRRQLTDFAFCHAIMNERSRFLPLGAARARRIIHGIDRADLINRIAAAPVGHEELAIRCPRHLDAHDASGDHL